MTTNDQLILSALIGFAAAVAAYIAHFLLANFIERAFGFRFYTPRDEREATLERRIEALERELREQREEIEQLRNRNEFLIDELKRAGAQIGVLRERQNKRIERDGAGEVDLSFLRERPRILGIWPIAMPVLDTESEREGIYNAGYDYVSLAGEAANRAGVIREMERHDPHIIEIGAHGSPRGIVLSDGITPPGWWGRLARMHSIRLAIVLACHADDQETLNVADNLIRAGVANVIAASAAIPDVDAVRFAQMLYDRLSIGDTLGEAVEAAKLAISDAAQDVIRLRQRRPEPAHN